MLILLFTCCFKDRKDETYLTSAYYINNTVNNTEVTSRGIYI